jgi:hypothetical protein
MTHTLAYGLHINHDSPLQQYDYLVMKSSDKFFFFVAQYLS